MKNITQILIFFLYFSPKYGYSQLFIQPLIGSNYILVKTIKTSNFLVNAPESNPYYGLSIGYKKNKISHNLGYIKYDIGISYRIFDKSRNWGVGWGIEYVENKNIFYGIDYNALHWKRLNIQIGSKFHWCRSLLTYGTSGKSASYIDDKTNPEIHLEGVATYQANKGSQIMFEPYVDIDLRIFKKLYWSNHFGFVKGTKTIYTNVNNYSINGVKQPEGIVKVDGTGLMFGTGFKFYLKNQEKK